MQINNLYSLFFVIDLFKIQLNYTNQLIIGEFKQMIRIMKVTRNRTKRLVNNTKIYLKKIMRLSAYTILAHWR
jgi:hypothetical protein